MTPYTGQDSFYVHTVNLPQNAVDNVDDTTVNPAFKILSDTDAYLARSCSNFIPPLRIYSSFGPIGLGKDIVIDQFVYVIGATDGGVNAEWWSFGPGTPTIIDELQLEGGGTYANNTKYWIYTYPSISLSGATAQFVISTTPPDGRLNVDSGGNGWRYLASFRTDGSGDIKSFMMVNRQYYLGSELLGTLTINSMTPSTVADFTVPGRAAKLLFKINTQEATNTQLFWFPKGGPVTTGSADILAQTAGSPYLDTVIDEVPTNGGALGSSQITVQLTNAAPTNPCTVDIYLTGYKE